LQKPAHTRSANQEVNEPAERNNGYVLATGSSAVDRLRLLDEIFGPASRQVLTRVGLSSARRIAEIGCGTGIMTTWMAEQVGAGSSVWGVDNSEQQLAVASDGAKAAGRQNITFHAAPAEDTRLPHGSFDLVYCRFLLCHLTNPVSAVKEMWSLLRTGGTLVCEDFEMSAVATCPPTSAYQRLIEISRAVDLQRGVDSDIGAKLHTLLAEAGFREPEVAVYQPAFLRGQPKEFWKITLREAQPAIVESGIASVAQMDSLCNELERIAADDSVLLLVARVYQVWCQKL
jgi:ubiquinone/menaquinone biosynthesis C-methylase UbiE